MMKKKDLFSFENPDANKNAFQFFDKALSIPLACDATSIIDALSRDIEDRGEDSHFYALFDAEYDMNPRKGDTGRLSFPRVASAMAEFFSSRQLVHGRVPSLRHLHYLFATRTDFWDSVSDSVQCVDEMLEFVHVCPHFLDESKPEQRFLPSSIYRICAPFVRLARELTQTHQEETLNNPAFRRAIDDVHDLLVEKGDDSKLLQPNEDDDSTKLRHTRQQLTRIKRAWQAPEERRAAREHIRRQEAEKRDLAVAYRFQFGIDIPQEEEPGPGNVHPDGPRHDNDHDDFRRISVLPSDDEMRCKKPPYLPVKGHSFSGHVSNKVDRYLDIQYRLLREDMVAPFRRSTQALLDCHDLDTELPRLGGFKKFRVTEARHAQDGDREREQTVSLNVWRNANVVGFEARISSGVSANVEFDLPNPVVYGNTHLRDASKKKRVEYWEKGRGSRHLQYGSMACLALAATSAPTADNPRPHKRLQHFFFATVSQYDRKLLAGGRPRGAKHGGGADGSGDDDDDDDGKERERKDGERRGDSVENDVPRGTLSLTFFRADDILQIGKLEDDFASGIEAVNHEWILVQVHGHFFQSYGPVLEGLKEAGPGTLPLADIITYDFLPDTISNENRQEAKQCRNDCLEPPSYLNNSVLDVSFLLDRAGQGGEHRQRELHLRINTFEGVVQQLREHQNVMLDDAQKEAFALALTRKISLIQGPPGTGKTYVGVHIMRALLQNADGATGAETPLAEQMPGRKRYITPILCVCYTNHALDQFLEHLLDAGVSTDKLVRVGGRSKSDRLQECSLNTRDVSKTQGQKKATTRLKQKAGVLELQLEDFLGRFQAEKAPLEFLWERYPKHAHAIVFPGEPYREHRKNSSDDIDSGADVDEQGFAKVTSKKITPKKRFKKWVKGHSSPATNKSVLKKGGMFAGDAVKDPQLVWDLSKDERQLLLDLWTHEYRHELDAEMESVLGQYKEVADEWKQRHGAIKASAVKDALVVGMTTTGCAMYHDLIAAVQPRVVVIEEAGEVLESHIITSMPASVEQVILIGDHQQLRPGPAEYSLTTDAGRGFELNISLFERLVKARDKWRETDPLLPRMCVTLTEQRRMRPEISSMIRDTGYYEMLRDSGHVHEHPYIRGFDPRTAVWFFNHGHTENQSKADTSYANSGEAELVVALIKYVIRQGYKRDQIAVLTPYVGQLLELRRLFKQQHLLIDLSDRDKEEYADLLADEGDEEGEDEEEEEKKGTSSTSEDDEKMTELIHRTHKLSLQADKDSVVLQQMGECVRLATVDNFQGEEAEIVIISTVRSNRQRRTGFLKIDNRVNVMMSRAKHGMILLGSFDTVCGGHHRGPEEKKTLFRRALELMSDNGWVNDHLPLYCPNHNITTHVRNKDDFRKVKDGGCEKRCVGRLECGHACPLQCHPLEAGHPVKCMKSCARTLPGCGHPCQRNCSEPCGGCDVKVEVSLRCGHTHVVECGKRDSVVCKQMVQVERKLALCEHAPGAMRCSQYQLLLELHNGSSSAAHLALFGRCQSKCGIILSCSHACERSCGACSKEIAFRVMKDEGKMLSEVMRDKEQHTLSKVKCSKVCERGLLCGHLCQAVCCKQGECPPCTDRCFRKCSHSSCTAKCTDVCASCAEECTRGCMCTGERCPLPCGAPCTLLPCDNRCPQTLSCRHRCPSVCGEKCPDPAYCRECMKEAVAIDGEKVLAKDFPHARDQVDVIMCAELYEHDPDESPLIILTCGHAYTVETLDGTVDIRSVYETDSEGKPTDVKSLSTVDIGELVKRFRCPSCRHSLEDVQRYSRIRNCIQLNLSSRKWMVEGSQQYTKTLEKLQHIRLRVERDGKAFLATSDAAKVLVSLTNKATAACELFRKKHPTLRVRDAERAYLLQSGLNPNQSDFNVVPINMKPQCQMHLARFDCCVFVMSCTPLLTEYTVKKKSTKKKKEKEKKKKANVGSGSDALQEAQKEKRGVETHFSDRFHLARDMAATAVTSLHCFVEDCTEGKLAVLMQKNAVRMHVELLCTVGEIFVTFSSLVDKNCPLLLNFVEFCEGHLPLSPDTKGPFQMKCAASARERLSEAKGDHGMTTDEEKTFETRVDALERGTELTLEEKKMIFDVMSSEVGGGIGSFGGHWYECPNGHVYTIGECGGAMQQSKCPDCGETVGGTQHRLDGRNRPATSFLQDVNAARPQRNWREQAERVFDIPDE